VQERLAVAAEKAKTAPPEPEVSEEPTVAVELPAVDPAAAATEAAPVAAPETPAEKAEEKPATEEQPPLMREPIITPEALTKMVTDNPEFGKLLESDPKLKGQLYKTTREAAELKPYREIFPDLESAKEAVTSATAFNEMSEVFMSSTTKEGTMKALGKMAELCYERDDDGNVLMQNGRPVIGDDFYGFVDNVVAMDIEHRLADVSDRLEANQYHKAPEIETTEQAQAAYDKDFRLKKQYDEMLAEMRDPKKEDSQALPENLRRKVEDIERREAKLREREHGSQVQTRQQFETSLIKDARTRADSEIGKIIARVKAQGSAISPYLEETLPKGIQEKLWKKIGDNPGFKRQMLQLQRLPVGDKSRGRRLAVVDRAIQLYLPDIAMDDLEAAGVQIVTGAKAKQAKEASQAEATRQTEPRGSTAPAGSTAGQPVGASTAFDTAQAEWQRANPGKPFDKVARELILPRVLQLLTSGGR
jgi:hypothetical protein